MTTARPRRSCLTGDAEHAGGCPHVVVFGTRTISAKERRIYRFGGFELEPLELRLVRGTTRMSLRPNVFDTLVLLVERAGRVVSKDELMTALWLRGLVEAATLRNPAHARLSLRGAGDCERRVDGSRGTGSGTAGRGGEAARRFSQ